MSPSKKLRLLLVVTCTLILQAASAPAQAPTQAPPPSSTSSSGAVASAGIFSRNGTIVLKVPSFDAAYSQLADSARGRGGELLSSSTHTDEKGRKYGWMVFELPVAQIPPMYSDAGTAGKLYAQKFDAVKNQSEYEGLARRADSLRKHEDRLTGILESPRHMRGGDILFLQERLYTADVEAEMLLQRRDDLLSGNQTGKLKIELFEPNTMPVPESTAKIDLGKWYRFGLLRARHEFERYVARATTGGAYALVYAPLWGPLAAVALVLLWILWRMRMRIWNGVISILSAVARPLLRAAILIRDNAVGWRRQG